MTIFGSLEAGGTKFVTAVGTGPDDILDQARFDTTDPGLTLPRVVEFFRRHRGIAAIGVASFGPVELRPDHPAYGHVTTTPKPGWAGADLVGPLAGLGVPVGLETDVVGAAMGEWRWGAGEGLDNLIYVTVGTGIGGGQVIRGAAVPGLGHSEMGHVAVPRHPADDFAGVCPFHGDCLEGLASGSAIGARWGRPASDLGDRLEPAVEMEAHYLAAGFRTLVYTMAPHRIILGGGVSKLPGLVEMVGARLVDDLAGYAVHPEHREGFVTAPGLGDLAGIAGGFVIARRAWS